MLTSITASRLSVFWRLVSSRFASCGLAACAPKNFGAAGKLQTSKKESIARCYVGGQRWRAPPPAHYRPSTNPLAPGTQTLPCKSPTLRSDQLLRGAHWLMRWQTPAHLSHLHPHLEKLFLLVSPAFVSSFLQFYSRSLKQPEYSSILVPFFFLGRYTPLCNLNLRFATSRASSLASKRIVQLSYRDNCLSLILSPRQDAFPNRHFCCHSGRRRSCQRRAQALPPGHDARPRHEPRSPRHQRIQARADSVR